MRKQVERTVSTKVDGVIISEKKQCFPSKMSEEGYRFNSTKAGVTVYSDVPYPSAMTKSEIGAMTLIARGNLVGETGMIGYRSHGKIKAYSAAEIMRLGGYSDRQGRSFLKKMLRLHMLQKLNTLEGVQFYANPVYWKANGRLVPLSLFLLFQSDLSHVLEPWVVNEFLRQAGEKQLRATNTVEDAENLVSGLARV